MGNLTERTKRMVVNVLYLLLSLAIAYGLSMAIVSCLGCSLHVHLKDTHYHGTELPQEAKATDLIERIFDVQTTDEE